MILLAGLQTLMLIAAAIGFTPAAEAARCIQDETWAQSTVLNTEGEYTLNYKVNSTALTVGLRVKTTGWIGLGISESGQMAGSDIVTAAVVSGKPRVEDRFALWDAFPFEGSLPKLDKCQSWHVHCALEQNGYTEVVLSRLLNTHDTEDRAIVDGDMYVIYAWGTSDTIAYHAARRGSQIINFFQTQPYKFVPPPDVDGFVDIVLGNYKVTQEETQYVLQKFDVGTDIRHVVAVEPLIRLEDKDIAHHILVHDCGLRDTEAPVVFLTTGVPLNAGLISPLGLGSCMGLITGWSHGGQARLFPNVAGYKLGGEEGARYLVLEVHIDNPKGLSGRTMASGIRLHTSTKLRKYDVGTLVVGDAQVRFSSIPAGQPKAHYESTCPPECLRTFGGDIIIFHSFPHTHSYGREIWSTKYAANGDVTQISHKQYWNFGHQSQVTNFSVTITATDKISTHCVYDTTKSPIDIKFGSNSNDEMCMDFMAYYPKQHAGLHCGYRSPTSTLCRNAMILNDVPNPKPDGFVELPASLAVGNEPQVCTVIEVTNAPDSQQEVTSAPTPRTSSPTLQPTSTKAPTSPTITGSPTTGTPTVEATYSPTVAVTNSPTVEVTRGPTVGRAAQIPTNAPTGLNLASDGFILMPSLFAAIVSMAAVVLAAFE